MDEKYKNIIKEIYQYKAHVICFQELDLEAEKEYFSPVLKRLGYNHKFQENLSGEGVAIYYKKNR